jgi:hypothetical protein
MDSRLRPQRDERKTNLSGGTIRLLYIYSLLVNTNWLVVKKNILKNMNSSNGTDYTIYHGKKMFQTTNQQTIHLKNASEIDDNNR